MTQKIVEKQLPSESDKFGTSKSIKSARKVSKTRSGNKF